MVRGFCHVPLTASASIGCQMVKLVGPGLREPMIADVLAEMSSAEYCFGEFAGRCAEGIPVDGAEYIVLKA